MKNERKDERITVKAIIMNTLWRYDSLKDISKVFLLSNVEISTITAIKFDVYKNQFSI